MVALATDYFVEVGNPGTATTLAAPGHSIAGTTFNVVSTSNWPTTTGVIFAVDNYTLQTVNGVPNTPVRTPGTYTEWEGVVASGTQITGAVLRYGTDQNYAAGSLTRVYIPVASSKENRLSQGIRIQHNQDGTHGAVTATSVVASGTITASSFIQSGGGGSEGWTIGAPTPNTITYNGNRSYTAVYTGQNLTTTQSPGMRQRFTRTVTAPTQSTSLNGTTQYYSRASGSLTGITFTNNFVVSAWVKLSSYAAGAIASRYNGTSGWTLQLNSSGQLQLLGLNAGAANFRGATTYQSLPLNKWVHVAMQIDMTVTTNTPTTNYALFDGVDVPAQSSSGGTNPTALIQAGNLEIGAINGGTQLLPGKLAQVAIYSAKVTQANIRATISQGLAGTETSLISAYSFNNSITDLNTTNANNLTANGAAVATNADSPFSVNSFGTATGTTDYGIVTAATFSTDTTVTFQVPEGNTVPTSGGVSAVAYSSNKAPYGMPDSEKKWEIGAVWAGSVSILTGSIAATWGALTGTDYTFPVGIWKQRSAIYITDSTTTTSTNTIQSQWDTATPTVSKEGQETARANVTTQFFLYRHRHLETIEVTTPTVFRLYCVIIGGAGTQTAYLEPTYFNYLTLGNGYL